jgi:ketosteroid isomerase-like protein
MRHVARLLVAYLLAAAPARAQTPSPAPQLPSVTLPAELERVLRDYERAWQAKDPAALASLFTEDGFVLPNGKPPVRGRAAIRGAYQEAGGALKLRALAYAVADSVGYIIGAYTWGDEPATGDSGKFILALRRASGGPWLVAADIDNMSRRPRPGPD